MFFPVLNDKFYSINRLISEAYKGERLVLIENEFGEIGIDGGFLQESGIEITEMNSGCICCSLVGDFSKSLKEVVAKYAPDRILIEPSGVGKLSDVTRAVVEANIGGAVVNSAVVVVDVNKCKMYMKNFGEFFNDQIEHAGCIYFSHTDKTTDAKITEAISLVRAHNATAEIITTPISKLDIDSIITAFEKRETLNDLLNELVEEEECPVCGHHHHHHEHHNHDECCEHEHHNGHEYHHHGESCEHKHHHHDHDKHCDCHEHHHHDHDEHCDCHEHHHHADYVFTSWGTETVIKYSVSQISDILSALENTEKYGFILRAKGIVEGTNGAWIHFDYVPEEKNVRNGSAATIGKICVIGSKINESAVAELFGA